MLDETGPASSDPKPSLTAFPRRRSADFSTSSVLMASTTAQPLQSVESWVVCPSRPGERDTHHNDDVGSTRGKSIGPLPSKIKVRPINSPAGRIAHSTRT